MSLFVIIIVSISLSMDAFSLSLIYGTLGMTIRDKWLLSIITGVFHFFMPLLGFVFGNVLFNFVKIDSNLIVFVIFSFIGIEMIVSSFKKEKDVKKIKGIEFLLFGLAVSLDSFSVGITLNGNNNFIMGPIFFSFFSFLFTFLGLNFGSKIKNIFGEISSVIGGVLLLIIGVCYII
ncbi:MAG: manganese efflux pump [Bacilli bacterium]|nr:manganese efflux pump [Bacilli bacterium]